MRMVASRDGGANQASALHPIYLEMRHMEKGMKYHHYHHWQNRTFF
jgi:hypothetical protein